MSRSPIEEEDEENLPAKHGGRPTPGHPDTIEKMMYRMQCVTRERLVYNGKIMRSPSDHKLPDVPSEFYISPATLRKFECVAGCTACCQIGMTLDFTPEEFETGWKKDITKKADAKFKTRKVEVNGVVRKVVTYRQYQDPKCPFLGITRPGGHEGCEFWGSGTGQPLECSAAPQLLLTMRGAHSVITSKPFGRAWRWKDKPQCAFDPVVDSIDEIPLDAFEQCESRAQVLRRYLHWATYFDIETVLPEAIKAVEVLPNILRDHGIKSWRYA